MIDTLLTPAHPDLTRVLWGVLGGLVIASLVGGLLRLRLGATATVENFNARVRAW